MQDLPEELHVQIFNYLSLREKLHVQLTCKPWCGIIQSPVCWAITGLTESIPFSTARLAIRCLARAGRTGKLQQLTWNATTCPLAHSQVQILLDTCVAQATRVHLVSLTNPAMWPRAAGSADTIDLTHPSHTSHLHITHSHRAAAAVTVALVQRALPSLQSLHIAGCDGLPVAVLDLPASATALPLESLHVAHWPATPDPAAPCTVRALLAAAPRLRKLQVLRGAGLVDAALIHTQPSAPQPSPVPAVAIAARASRPESQVAPPTQQDGGSSDSDFAGVPEIRRSRKRRRDEMATVPAPPPLPPPLSPAIVTARIQRLTLAHQRALSDRCIASVVQHIDKLRVLQLQDCQHAGAQTGQALAKHAGWLSRLSIAWTNIPDEAIIEFTAAGAAPGTAQLPLLQADLTGCKRVGDAACCALLRACPRIKALQAAWCKRVTQATLQCAATGAPELAVLDVRQCSVPDDSLHALQPGGSLHDLAARTTVYID